MFIYGFHLGDKRYRYVGLTTRKLEDRMYGHKYSVKRSTTPVACWIKKHGWESVVVDILDTTDDRDELLNLEFLWIARLRGEGFDLLNLTDGGEGLMNPTPEVRARMSAARSGERNPFYGKKMPEHVRKALRENTVSGEKHPQWGKPRTEAQKQATSIANKGRIVSEETRAKLRAAATGHVASDETRAKHAEISRKRFAEKPLGAKIDWAISREIREHLSCGLNDQEIADIYNVSKSIVQNIRLGITWREK